MTASLIYQPNPLVFRINSTVNWTLVFGRPAQFKRPQQLHYLFSRHPTPSAIAGELLSWAASIFLEPEVSPISIMYITEIQASTDVSEAIETH